MYYAFQDRENLYLVMDYLSGGDLRYHICRNKRFSEEITSKHTPLPEFLNLAGLYWLCCV